MEVAMSDARKQALLETYAEANNIGWKTFSNKRFKEIRNTNPILHGFILRQLKEQRVEEYEIDIIRECIALLVNIIPELLVVESAAIAALELQLIFPEYRKQILGDGERFLKSEHMYGIYKEFMAFSNMVSGNDSVFMRHILYFFYIIGYLLVLSDFAGEVMALRNRIE